MHKDIIEGTRLRKDTNHNLLTENKARGHWFSKEAAKPVITYKPSNYITPQVRVEMLMYNEAKRSGNEGIVCEDLM